MLDKDYLSSDDEFLEASTHFTQNQIDEAVSKLSDYRKYDDVVVFNSAEQQIPAGAMAAFADLAKALKLPVVTQYGNLFIKREISLDRKQKLAIQDLWNEYRNALKSGRIS